MQYLHLNNCELKINLQNHREKELIVQGLAEELDGLQIIITYYGG